MTTAASSCSSFPNLLQDWAGWRVHWTDSVTVRRFTQVEARRLIADLDRSPAQLPVALQQAMVRP